MKTNRLLLLCILCLCTYTLFATSPKREFRATWLAAVGVDWPASTSASSQKTQITTVLDNLVAGNQNAICYHARPMADAFYQSNVRDNNGRSLVPWSHYISGARGTSPGYDPLQYAIEQAHARGLELHAWLNPYRYRAQGIPSSYYTNDNITKYHPDWILDYTKTTSKGTILDPGNPDVRAHIVAVVQEIVENYDVDGIIFDDYFYPYGGTTTEDAASVEKWKPDGMSVGDWRRQNVDETIRAVYEMIANSSRPWVRFGISPFGIWTIDQNEADRYGITLPSGITGSDQYKDLGCNTVAWMQGGYVDYISPQLYWPTTQTAQSYTVLCEWWSDIAKSISDALLERQKVHFFASQDVSASRENDTGEIGDQVDYNRQFDQLSAPGSIFFSYKDLVGRGMNSYLAANKFTSLSLPPAMDWKATETLAAPTNVTLSGSTLSWRHADAERFTVYAYMRGSNNAEAMADPSNLVRVVYGKSLDVSSVSDYQNKTFAVCAYDRYGNEFAAGYYNLQVTEPTITANPASFTLTGKHTQESPYVDIHIEGLNLSMDMSVNPSTDFVSVEKLTGWNDRTGGTLRVTLSSTATVGSNTGYIAVVSGSMRLEIPFTATVLALNPTITATPSSVTLTGVQNSVNPPSKEISVVAEDLSADITITHSELVRYTLSNWNARTGGKLTVILDTSKELGEHTGTLTLSSGTTVQTITIHATISEKTQNTPDWTTPMSDGTSRSMAIHDGTLYLSKSDGYYTVNRETGTLTTHAVSGIGGFHGHNFRVTLDGQMLVGNTGYGANNALTVYKVNSTTATSLANITTNGRTADYFNVYGNWNTSGYILAIEKDETGRVTKIPIVNGTLQTSTSIASTALKTNSNICKAYPIDETLFYASVPSQHIRKINFTSGEVIETMPVTAATSGLAVFTIHKQTYMVVPTDVHGGFKIYNITNGLGSAAETTMSGAALGGETNHAGVEFCTYIEGNDVYLYALAPYDGLAAYTYTFLPEPELVASEEAIVLAGEQEAVDVHRDITITGISLTNDIAISNSNTAITYECLEDWNARTGGTLRIKLNTNKEIGTYEGNITLTSGSLSATIAVTATVEEMVQIDETPFVADKPLAGTGILNENAIWKIKATDEGSCISTSAGNRSIAYYDNVLYIPDHSAGKLYRVNASTGQQIEKDNTFLGLTGYHRLNLRVTTDGQLLGGNAVSPATTMIVHTVDRADGTAESKLTTTTTARTDFFYTYGSWETGGYLLAAGTDGTVKKISFIGGALDETSITSLTGASGTGAKAIPSPDGQTFYSTAFTTLPAQRDITTGAVLDAFKTGKTSTGNTAGLGVFVLHGNTYMVTPNDRYGAFELWDITDGLNQATSLGKVNPALGTASHTDAIVDFCTHVEGNDAYIYVLAPNNGVAAYKFTFTPKYDCVFTNESGDGNWGTASNWQDGKMPTLTDHVLVKAPCMVNVNNAVAKSINLLKGSGTLTVAAQAALTVDGTVRRVENETFPATRSYTSVSDILIEANANSTGIFAHKDAEGKTRATVQIYGDYTTENGYDNVKWQYVAMPSHQEHAITQFTGGWLLRFDEPNDDWAYLNDADPVELFQGYLLLQPSIRTYNFPSKLAPVTPQTITLSRKGATGENLLGNSWTAPLHINQFTESDFVNIDATIHLWDYQDGDDGSYGVYHEHPIKSSETVINPLQAFFIVTNVDGATIKLDPANLISSTGSHVTLNPYKAPQRATAMYEEMGIRVTGNDKYYCDVRLLQNEEYTAGFDNGYDGRKLEGDAPIPYLAGVSTDGDMAVLATPQYDGTYLNFRKGSNGEQYTFTFTYDGTTEYYLEDMHLGIRQAIRAGETYTFTPSDDDSYRFRVVAAQKAPDQTTDVPTVWASDSKLYLTNPLGVETTVAVYSASGQLIQMSTTTDVLQPLESLTTGVYIIYVRSCFGTQMIKHIM